MVQYCRLLWKRVTWLLLGYVLNGTPVTSIKFLQYKNVQIYWFIKPNLTATKMCVSTVCTYVCMYVHTKLTKKEFKKYIIIKNRPTGSYANTDHSLHIDWWILILLNYIVYISGYEKGLTQQELTGHIFTSCKTRFQYHLRAPCVISGRDGTDHLIISLVCVIRPQETNSPSGLERISVPVLH